MPAREKHLTVQLCHDEILRWRKRLRDSRVRGSAGDVEYCQSRLDHWLDMLTEVRHGGF